MYEHHYSHDFNPYAQQEPVQPAELSTPESVEAGREADPYEVINFLLKKVEDQQIRLTEQEGDLDSDTRFCLKWYEQYAWDKAPFGDADVLARAYNTSVLGLADSGVLTQGEGVVRLVRPQHLPTSWNPLTDHRISVWEVTCHLARVLAAEDGGIEVAARLMTAAGTRSEVDLEAVQRLAYRLYEMTQKSRPDDARLFNLLGGSWSEVTEAMGRVQLAQAVQSGFDFEGEA